jgi:hypothetical protein
LLSIDITDEEGRDDALEGNLKGNLFGGNVKVFNWKGERMQKESTVQMTVRVTPTALELVRKHAEGKHGMGYLVDKAIRAYFQQNGKRK